MKCWECKKQINMAHKVFYYSPYQGKTASRDVCNDCYSKLRFNPCHYVEVKKITQRSLNVKKGER